MQIYARDGLEAPLLKLQGMLEDIRIGKFDPDAEDLLGWWSSQKEAAKASELVEIGEPGQPARNPIDLPAASDSSSSSSSLFFFCFIFDFLCTKCYPVHLSNHNGQRRFVLHYYTHKLVCVAFARKD